MSKRWYWVGGIVAITAAAITAGTMRGNSGPAPRFETADVQRGPLTAKVTATGTLSALVTVQVGTQVSGRLQDILVDYNSPVKKGQLIARIDPQLFLAAVEQTKANYASAVANLAKAKVMAENNERNYQRQKALADKALIAAADLDTAEATWRGSVADVQAAQAALQQADAAKNTAAINLAYTSIVSPINGTVISRNVDVGQTVAASLQAPVLFTIAEDLTRMQVDTNVAEADVGKLQPGTQATFTVDAYPQTPFTGTIRQIRNAPITVQNVVTYDAVIDVENPDLKLKPGMTANVTVVYARSDDALKVPNAALRFRLPAEMRAGNGSGNGNGNGRGNGRPGGGRGTTVAGGPGTQGFAGAPGAGGAAGFAGNSDGERGPGEKVVWVLRNGSPARVKVVPGITDGTYTEVASADLHEGDKVITDTSGGANGQQGFRPPRMF